MIVTVDPRWWLPIVVMTEPPDDTTIKNKQRDNLGMGYSPELRLNLCSNIFFRHSLACYSFSKTKFPEKIAGVVRD